jgi:hypothetical protein
VIRVEEEPVFRPVFHFFFMVRGAHESASPRLCAAAIMLATYAGAQEAAPDVQTTKSFSGLPRRAAGFRSTEILSLKSSIRRIARF